MKIKYRIEIIVVFFIPLAISCNNSGSKFEQKLTTESENLTENNSNKSNKDFSKIGFELMKKERIGGIVIGLSLAETVEKLGEPEEKTKPEFWGADGEYHQTVKYNSKGIELDLIGEFEFNRLINMITISEPCPLRTNKGIGIGSSYKEVESQYNGLINPEYTDSTTIVVGTIYGGIIFKFSNNNVNSIFIGASAE